MSETPATQKKTAAEAYDEYKAAVLSLHNAEENLEAARKRFGNALNTLNQALVEAEKEKK